MRWENGSPLPWPNKTEWTRQLAHFVIDVDALRRTDQRTMFFTSAKQPPLCH